MRVLDLFCGAGGAAMGLHRAWPEAEIVGVDIKPQPRYPFKFIQGDWSAHVYRASESDFIWASPPCHHYSRTQHRKNAGVVYPDLIDAIREVLIKSGHSFCIENVEGARAWLIEPVMLCGGMFGLGVVRHRLFETNWPLAAPAHLCNRANVDSDEVSVTRHGPPARWYRKNPGRSFNVTTWHKAMGIDWMDRNALTQAVPPAYSEYIARQWADSKKGVWGTHMGELVYKFVFDKKQMKPACVLLQAMYGGDREPCFFFTDWAIAPTDDMIGVRGTESEVLALAKICNERARRGGPDV